MNTEDKEILDIEISLVNDQRGDSFIEKLVMIGLFVIAAAVGVTALSGSVSSTMTTQGTTLTGMGAG